MPPPLPQAIGAPKPQRFTISRAYRDPANDAPFSQLVVCRGLPGRIPRKADDDRAWAGQVLLYRLFVQWDF